MPAWSFNLRMTWVIDSQDLDVSPALVRLVVSEKELQSLATIKQQ